MTFADFIESNLNEIVAEWQVFARSVSPQADAMAALALDDHAHEMLRAIAKDMRTPQTEGERASKSKGAAVSELEAPETAAFTHGVLRHVAGFDIGQVVSEFRALRASVLSLWRNSVAARLGESELEELVRFNEGLDQALAEAITSYSARANHSRDMFLAVLGHDVRGPLSGISMATSLLESPTLETPVRMQVALRIRRAVGVVNRLTTDLLEYARSRLGTGMPVEQSECDVRELCEEAVDAFKAAHPDQVVSTDYVGDLQARCDIARIQQALGNLLSNAAQHGDSSRPISVAARRQAGSIVLSVKNHGQPIPEDAFTRIFEPMFRLPPARNESFEPRSRVGLGLFIVKQVIEAHGGGVAVESSEQETVFTLRLPDAP